MKTSSEPKALNAKETDKLYRKIYKNRKRGFVDISLFNIIFSELDTKLLDVGCGFGELISALNSFNFETKGIVLTWFETEACKRKGLNVVRGDAGKSLPFKSEEFGSVTFIDSIEHIEDHKNALLEALRVLRVGGKILIYTPNREKFRKDLSEERKKRLNPVHFKEFTKKELETSLSKTGFTNIQFICKKLYYPKYFFLRSLNTFIQKGNRKYLCVIAEKEVENR